MTVNSSASLRVSILFPLAHVIIITPLLPFNLNTKFYSILQLLSTNLTLPIDTIINIRIKAYHIIGFYL